MLSAIVGFSLRHRGIVIALGIALLVYGWYTLQQSRYDVFPDFAPPRVDIITDAPGLSPEQVELLVTQPIEYAIYGVPGIDLMLSNSVQGVSSVSVTFHPSTQIYLARQLVAERLAYAAAQLPAGTGPPQMTPLTSSTEVVLMVGLTSKARSLLELRTVADWTVRPRLLAANGVANVGIWGGEVKQFQVQYSPERLLQYDLAVNDLLAHARLATGLRGAGFVDTPNQRLILSSQGQSITAPQLAKAIVVYRNGAAVTLGQVASVAEAPAPRIGAASIKGKDGISMVISEQYGANTLQVTAAVAKALDDLRPVLQREGVTLYPDLFRPADFIDTALHNIRSSLLIGAILVVAVLLLFLFNFRTAAIGCAT